MSKVCYLVTLLCCFILICAPASAESKPVVAVVDFSNNSGEYLPGIERVSSEVLSTLLAETGRFAVVERDKLESIMMEQGFSMSGLVDTSASAVQVGRLLGATYLVTGSIVAYGSDLVNFTGYGISSTKKVTSMTATVKIIGVTTGQIEYASMFSAEDTTLVTGNTYVSDSQVASKLLIKILNSAVGELAQQMSPTEDVVPSEVLVTFKSTPSRADVEIDGIYCGSTPVTVPLAPGLHQVTISLANYNPWTKTIRAYDGLTVHAALEEKQADEGGQ